MHCDHGDICYKATFPTIVLRNIFNHSPLERMRSGNHRTQHCCWEAENHRVSKDHVTFHSDREMPLTSLTGSSPVASACAVTDEAVPAVLAHSIVLAGVAVTLLGAHA